MFILAAITTCARLHPCFCILCAAGPVSKPGQLADDALHYGQKLRIIANPMVQGETLDGVGGSRPLYLYSRPVGTTHFAKFSRHQLVALTDRASYDTVWQVSVRG